MVTLCSGVQLVSTEYLVDIALAVLELCVERQADKNTFSELVRFLCLMAYQPWWLI